MKVTDLLNDLGSKMDIVKVSTEDPFEKKMRNNEVTSSAIGMRPNFYPSLNGIYKSFVLEIEFYSKSEFTLSIIKDLPVIIKISHHNLVTRLTTKAKTDNIELNKRYSIQKCDKEIAQKVFSIENISIIQKIEPFISLELKNNKLVFTKKMTKNYDSIAALDDILNLLVFVRNIESVMK